jgi:hypothetical protein
VHTAARLLTLVVILGGCADVSTDALAGRTFLSTTIAQDGTPRPLSRARRSASRSEPTTPSAPRRLQHDGRSYRVEAPLRVDAGAMTEMACDEPRMAQDDWVSFIGSGPTISLDGDELVLHPAASSPDFDREGRRARPPLVGPTWTVDSIVAGDAVSASRVVSSRRSSSAPTAVSRSRLAATREEAPPADADTITPRRHHRHGHGLRGPPGDGGGVLPCSEPAPCRTGRAST